MQFCHSSQTDQIASGNGIKGQGTLAETETAECGVPTLPVFWYL